MKLEEVKRLSRNGHKIYRAAYPNRKFTRDIDVVALDYIDRIANDWQMEGHPCDD